MTNTKPSVLVVDDKPNMLRLMTKVLGGIAQVHTADNGEDAVAILEREVLDVVLCDLRMPHLTGLEVLGFCKARQPRARFILMTAYATVETAVTALKDGAYDYLMKPFEPDEVKTTVLRALHSLAPRPLVAEDDELLPGVHARSSVMRELAAVVQQIAPTSISILVGGESGAGKGQLARAIHRLSAFREHPLYSLDCRTLPAGGVQEALTEFGLWGVGARTDAIQGGTLFVDHVDVLENAEQAALAHGLDGIRGTSTSPSPGIRLVTATQRDLDALVADGAFRRELFFQIRVASVAVPPLRKRPEDIPVLAASLLGEAESENPSVAGFTAGAMERLCAAAWPGNVRELRAVIEHAVAHAGPEGIGLEALPEWIQGDLAFEMPWETLSWADAVARGRADVARRYLTALLERFEGDVVGAAAQASVERESFYRLLRRHGIQPESFRNSNEE